MVRLDRHDSLTGREASISASSKVFPSSPTASSRLSMPILLGIIGDNCSMPAWDRGIREERSDTIPRSS